MFATSLTWALANVESELLGGVNVSLSCSYVHGKPLGRPGGRMPMKMPEISVTDNSAEIEERLVGYTITLLSGEEIVWEQFVTSTHVEFPFILSGNYEIRFTNDNYCFYGFFSI